MTSPPTDRDPDEQRDLFQDYNEFAKALRTWFVAYGIGGPVLLLTSETLRLKIAHSGYARSIAAEFLLGVALQILLAVLNKNALWLCYRAAKQPRLRNKQRYRLALGFVYAFWVEFIVDLVSLILFILATYRVFVLLTSA